MKRHWRMFLAYGVHPLAVGAGCHLVWSVHPLLWFPFMGLSVAFQWYVFLPWAFRE